MERTAGAAYGRACYGCFKTKCKCVPRAGGDGCERCHRLKRPCRPADTLRQRSGEKKQSSSDARISKVEDTLNQLVSLLNGGKNSGGVALPDGLQQQQPLPQQSQPQQQPVEATPPAAVVESADQELPHLPLMYTTPLFRFDDIDESSGNAIRLPYQPDAAKAADDTTFGGAASSSAMQWTASTDKSAQGTDDSVPVIQPNEIDLHPPHLHHQPSHLASGGDPDAASLDMFRSRMLQHFPLVYIPAECTVQQMQTDRPFLLRSIICVTTLSVNSRRARALELKRELCEQAFLRQPTAQCNGQAHRQQTVDLLLGLLVYIAWGWDHVLNSSRRGDASRLMTLAESLAGELRPMDKAAGPAHTLALLELTPDGTPDSANSAESETASAKLDRYRAVLGCFILGSAVASYFGHIDAPRWTPDMQQALEDISRAHPSAVVSQPLHPSPGGSDGILELQVRLQLLATRAAQIRERAQVLGQPPVETLPPAALTQIRGLMTELQGLRNSIPPELQLHFGLLAHTYYAELCVIQTIYEQQPVRAGVCPPPSLPSQGPTRLSCLWQSALAIRSFTSTCLTLSPAVNMRGISFVQWSQFSRCLAMLHHLDSLREPGWAPGVLRSLVDLPELLTTTASKLEEVAAVEVAESKSSASPITAADSVFMKLATGMHKFQSTYYGKGAQPIQDAQPRVEKAATNTPATPIQPEKEVEKESAEEPPTVAVAVDGLDVQHGGYDTSVTSWLDQFLVNFDEHGATDFGTYVHQ